MGGGGGACVLPLAPVRKVQHLECVSGVEGPGVWAQGRVRFVPGGRRGGGDAVGQQRWGLRPSAPACAVSSTFRMCEWRGGARGWAKGRSGCVAGLGGGVAEGLLWTAAVGPASFCSRLCAKFNVSNV